MIPLDIIPYIFLAALAVFISSVSQVLLKKEAMKEHPSVWSEYANPLVIIAYALMLVTTLMLVISFRGIPLSMGPVIEATSYLYVTIFGVVIFKEKLGRKKVFALALILLGIGLYALGL
ncbi:MAG: multidrug ABC transporter [Raoultibacter sp.]